VTSKSDSSYDESYGTYTYFKRYDSGSITGLYTGSTVTAEEYSEYRGETVPGFRKLQDQGKLVPHTNFWQMRNSGTTEGTAYIARPDGVDWQDEAYGDSMFGFPLRVTDGVISEAVNRLGSAPYALLDSAAAKIYSKHTFDALTFVKELHHTVTLFNTTGRRLVKAYKRLKSDRRIVNFRSWHGSALLYWRQFGNAWLEARYAWRTMLFDIEDLYGAIANLNKGVQRYSERVGVKSNTDFVVTGFLGDIASMHADYTSHVQAHISYRASMVADIALNYFQADPFITTWEVTRLSFVVDWFLNVGDWLRALHLAFSAEGYVGSTGEKLEIIVNTTANCTAKSGWSVDASCTWASRYEHVRRTPASLSFKPQIGINLSPAKVIDLAALLTQALGK
jgi:hypothetical protein